MKALLARRGPANGGADRTAGSGTDDDGSLIGRVAPDRITLATRVAAVVAGLGLLGVLVFGALWWTATQGSGAEAAAAREDSLAAARQIAVNLQTLDYQTVDKGLANWEASATGPLLDEFKKNHQQYADQIRKVQTSTNARLIDAALSDLDVPAGKARAVAAVDVTTTQATNGVPSLPVTKQVRIQLELVRTPDAGWKASAASAVRS
jgi:Mce-associated membrane protein